MENFERYVGQIFDNRYKLIRIVGVGGMAVVFEAHDLLMKRTVAVKMLKDDISDDTQAVKRFINESKAVAMLSHPNIVNIFDVSVKDNLKYIVMEYIEGITLKNYMTRRGTLSFRETVSYSEQILRALEHAHSKGIVHRDIKPQNIMLLKNGLIKVTDFGIAKLPNSETLTMTDKAIGTVYYISPEQASGHATTQASDLYSLGVLMYEMATGKLPFNADSPISVALMQVKNTPAKPRSVNPAIPKGLEQIILTALEKDVALRYQSASQMLKHITKIKENPDSVFNEESRGISGFSILLGIISSFAICTVVSALIVLICLAAPFLRSFFAPEDNPDVIIDATAAEQFAIVYDEKKDRAERENKSFDPTKDITTEDLGLDPDMYRLFIEYGPVDESKEPGAVLSQEPAVGDEVKIIPGQHKCDLTIYINPGPNTEILLDYSMQKYNQRPLERALNNLGLLLETEYVYSSVIPKDYISHTYPAAGTPVEIGETVTVFVSLGEKVTYKNVPDMTGLNHLDAAILLKESGFVIGEVIETYSSRPKGEVISHTPSAGTPNVPEGSKIDFVVSMGTTSTTPVIPDEPDTPDTPVDPVPDEDVDFYNRWIDVYLRFYSQDMTWEEFSAWAKTQE